MHSPDFLFLNNLFSSDMLIIIFVALLLFGGEKLPEIARGLGKGIRDFKDASEGVKREINNQINSFEEKRAETALDTQAAQSQLQENNPSVESRPHVENTIPVNENHFNASEGTAADNHTEALAEQVASHVESHAGPVTENHAANAHTGAGTTADELIKNS